MKIWNQNSLVIEPELCSLTRMHTADRGDLRTFKSVFAERDKLIMDFKEQVLYPEICETQLKGFLPVCAVSVRLIILCYAEITFVNWLSSLHSHPWGAPLVGPAVTIFKKEKDKKWTARIGTFKPREKKKPSGTEGAVPEEKQS